MADDAMILAEEFAPTFVYNGQRQARLCMTQEEYDVCCQQGWADTPAAFGIETHPASPVTTLLAPILPETASPPALVPQESYRKDLQSLNDLVVHTGQQQERCAKDIVLFQERCTAWIVQIRARLETVETALNSVNESRRGPGRPPRESGG